MEKKTTKKMLCKNDTELETIDVSEIRGGEDNIIYEYFLEDGEIKRKTTE